MSRKIYWVGPRQSDIKNVFDENGQAFYGSVTLFGDGTDNNYAYCLEKGRNRVNHNLPDLDEDRFFFETVRMLIEEDPSSQFYFYNPNCVYYIDGMLAYKDHFLCVNEREVMRKANDKVTFQSLLNGIVPLLDRREGFHRSNCDYMSLVREFGVDADAQKKFVFQAPVSSGGNGTYIVRKETVKEVAGKLSSDGYLVSVYEDDNIPVNIHAIIFDDCILLTPGSIQIMREDDSRLLYRGADFITYRTIAPQLRAEFEKYVVEACKVFRDMGYRGVCGIDGIVCRDKVMLLELNNRFQASTGLVDRAAFEAGLPSLQQINLAAFKGVWKEEFRAIEKLQVNYSNYFYTDNGTKFHSKHIHAVCMNSLAYGEKPREFVELDDDGYDEKQGTNSLAYLYRITFNRNITSIFSEKTGSGVCGFDQTIRLNENICEPEKEAWYDVIARGITSAAAPADVRNFYLYLKIALLMQGVTIDKNAEKHIRRKGGLRAATNNAVDLRLSVQAGGKARELIVNAPIDIRFIEFSPFRIVLKDNELLLNYYEQTLMPVGVYPLDPIAILEDGSPRYTKATEEKASVPYSEVAFLSTDRLRVHLTNSCIFKRTDAEGCSLECQFCNIKPSSDVLDLSNIEEVVEEYCAHSREIGLRHFLVGGQTAPDRDKDKIIEIIRIIRKNAPFAPIYAMVIPYSEQTIREMYEAGLGQLSCNIEVFDDDIARRYMPGKRSTSRNIYLNRLKYATKLMGRRGNVRSMVIVGLEPYPSLMEGIKDLALNGIQPILSIFRPLPDTPLEDLLPPSMLYLARIYTDVQRVCRANGLYAGPDCVNCQNNTLALPAWMEDLCSADSSF